MIDWQKTCLISPGDVAPSRGDFVVIGTFNPGAVRIGDTVHLLVRIAEQPVAPEDKRTIALPRYDGDGKLHVDYLATDVVDPIDARVVLDRRTGAARLTSVSYLRHFTVPIDRIDRPDAYVDTGNQFLPSAATETMGVEDPRITTIDRRHYLTYVSVSGHGACTSMAVTDDFRTFDRCGIQFPNENKDVVILPERINDRWVAIHRPVSATPFGPPEMWTAISADGRSWGHHHPMQFVGSSAAGEWSNGRVGAGTVPVRCHPDDGVPANHPGGWVSLFHGNTRSADLGEVGRYCGALMVGHADDPGRIVATSPGPVFLPDQPFETEGFVPGVVFPTAWIELDDRVAIFYGAADQHAAVAITDRRALLATAN